MIIVYVVDGTVEQVYDGHRPLDDMEWRTVHIDNDDLDAEGLVSALSDLTENGISIQHPVVQAIVRRLHRIVEKMEV